MINTNTTTFKNFITSKNTRILFGAALIALLFTPNSIAQAARTSFADAYIGVSVFVYMTLLVFYAVEKGLNFNLLESVQSKPFMQIVLAAGLGMMPGCGGAILIVTGFASGQLTFGAMVATLTATMGDAAFLLIAQSPSSAAIVLPVAFIAGIIMGILTDKFYKIDTKDLTTNIAQGQNIGQIRYRDWIIFAAFIPGIIMGILSLMQIELPAFVDVFAILVMCITLSVWVFSPMGRTSHNDDASITRANEETAFITVWVLVAFLLFEVSHAIFGFDLNNMLKGFIWLTPLIATIIGFIPGCGPQIITTTAYLSGAIPLGALLANAIANDGDALFPAIAISPKEALLASILTSIPAIILGYGFLLAFST